MQYNLTRRNQIATIPQKGEKGFQPVSSKYLEHIGGKGVNQQLAKDAEMSHEILRKIEILQEGATEELQEKLEK